MRPGIALRPDYDAAQLWALAKATRDAGQSGRFWPWPKSMMVAPGPRRHGSAALGCRPSGTGWCGSTLAALTA